ncbi:hypothetical protein ACJ41O_009759 [Fusarium nematophilum]
MALSLTSGLGQTYGGLNGYWGQYGDEPLKQYCDSSPEYVTLSFVNQSPENHPSGYPGTNFAGHCWAGVYENKNNVPSNLLSECKKIQEGIPYCQERGVKVLLSIGGEYDEAVSNYKVSSDENGVDFANFLYNAFGPYDPNWDGPRPFDAEDGSTRPSVDGFDFDIEHDLPNEPYVAMINELRRLKSDFIITAAPQCPTEPAYFYMEDLIQKAQFDALFIQFYNNRGCDAIDDPDLSWDNFNYDQWEEILDNSDCSKSAKIYVGLPASPEAAPAGGYLEPEALKELVCELKDKSHFAGISLWDLTRGATHEVSGKSYNQHAIDALEYGCDPVPTSTTTSVESTTTTDASSTTDVSTTDSTATTDASTTSDALTTESTATTHASTTSDASAADSTATTDVSATSDASSTTDATSTDASSTTDVSTAEQSSATSETSASSDATGTETASATTGSTASTDASTASTDSSAATSTGTNTAATGSLTTSDISTASTDSLTATSDVTNTETNTVGTDSSASTDTGTTSTDSSTGTRDISGTETSTATLGAATTSDGVTTSAATSTEGDSAGSTTEALNSATTSADVTLEATGSTSLIPEPVTEDATASESEPTSWLTTASTFRGWNATWTTASAHTQTYGNPVTRSTEGSKTGSEAISYTTSTVCTTKVHTVTECPPEVVDCPAGGYVTTETIPLYTTVCPVTAKATPTEYETRTVYTTNVHTVTKCPPEVVDCPVGSVTTETIPLYTTVCPVTETGNKAQPAPSKAAGDDETKTLYTTKVHTITQCPPEVPNCPIGSVTTEVASWTTTVVPAKETQVVKIHKPAAEIPEEVTTTVKVTGTIYSTIIVPPATLKTATKPGAVTEQAKPITTQPSGVAAPTGVAPTGGCTGEDCPKTALSPTSTPSPAPITPATAGGSSLAKGLTAVIGMFLFQVLAL